MVSVGAATATASFVFCGEAFGESYSDGAGSVVGESAGFSVASSADDGEQKLGTNSIAFTFNVENELDRSELPSFDIVSVLLERGSTRG